jgi:uncharacterized protein YecE (DUF72 family)
VLTRYSARLGAAEINTSFYRSHRSSTWAGWAQQTPEGFSFAVKGPRVVTHERRMQNAGPRLEAFRSEIAHLGERLGVVLFQLPPSLAFDPDIAQSFFEVWRGLYDGLTALEPRHASWLEAEELLSRFQVARVAADPARTSAFAAPGGWRGFSYWRWHGSPKMYASPYAASALAGLAGDLLDAAARGPAWAIFDNTMWGWAAHDALALQAMVDAASEPKLRGLG